MKNKNALLGMFMLTLALFCLLFFGMTKIDPRTSEWLGFVAITIALFLFLWGLVGTFILAQKTLRKKDVKFAVFMRQSSLLSLVIVVSMYLSRFELLSWLNVFILVGIVVLLEIYFIGKEEIQN